LPGLEEKMKKIYVTGGSGKAGKWVVLDLIENGFDVEVLDLAAPTDASLPFPQIDLTDYGQTMSRLMRTRNFGRSGAIHCPRY